VDALVVGLKADGEWDALNRIHLLCAARSFTGAMVPLKGTAMAATGLGAGNYARNGLAGNKSGYLEATVTVANNNHGFGVYVVEQPTVTDTEAYFGINTNTAPVLHMLYSSSSGLITRNLNSTSDTRAQVSETGYFGTGRSGTANYTIRAHGATATVTATATASFTQPIRVFGRSHNEFTAPSAARISVYVEGEAYDHAQVEARLDTFMAALTAALA
jgi:hypothetical protein